jgi:hypothetical protein
LALVGALSMTIGAVSAMLNLAPHSAVPASVSGFLIIAGGALTGLSKAIDSLNDALTSGSTNVG